MKYRLFSILIYLFIPFLQYAQLAESKVVYHCKTNLAQGPVCDGQNTLYFGADKSLYIHDDYPEEDSYEEKGFITHFIMGDPEGLPVFVNLKDKYLYYKSTYGGVRKHFFIFKEALSDIQWKILTDTKIIEEFNCVKAIGEFGGRTYDVWFTPDIPVSFGPFKLWGLPGLILEAKSRDGRVEYTFQAFYPNLEKEVLLQKPTNGKEISWSDFEQFTINYLLQVEAQSTQTVSSTNNDPPADWEIEKSKFTIISEYKRKRGDFLGKY